MPIHKTEGGWQWGNHGKVYASCSGAEKQAEAAHANGYKGDAKAAGVAVQAVGTGKLLFLKRSAESDHPGTWCFAGGHLEEGETHEQAALRETYEEAGIVPEEVSLVDVSESFVTYSGVIPDEVIPKLNKEHTAYAWAHPWDCPEPLHPGVAATLKVEPTPKVTRDFAGYYAPEKVGKTRRVTPEGYLVLVGTPIARLGTQVYASHEHPDLIPDGSGNIVVERLPEEVFSPESLASFEGKDYVINHPPDGVHAVNWKQFTVGHVQNIRRGEGIEDDLVLGDIIVKDPDGIEYVNKHLPENSAGYNADYEQVAPGRAIQRNIRGNHVAAVTAGRAGARVSVRDHLTLSLEDVMSKKTFWAAFRDGLTTLGVRTEDAAKMEAELKTNTMTTDNTADDIGEKLEGLSSDMKGIKDWMAARDAKDAADAKAVKDAADAKAVKDAADAKAVEDAKMKETEAEKTGDTLLEAEGPGTVINMGRMWKGALTGDSAATPEPVLQAVIARAEILAPGIQKITADSIVGNKGTVLASFMRAALVQHATTDAGRANIFTFTTDAPAALKGNDLVGVFNGAAQLARAQNNRAVSSVSRRMTGDFSKALPIAELNKRNAEYWEKRSKG